MTTHKINEAGLKLIKNFEGLRLTAYKALPTEKYYTIGYGHYGSDVKRGMKITEAQADAYLKSDVSWAESAVNRLVTAFINTHGYDPVERYGDNGFSALVSLTFNVGPAWTRNSGLRSLLLTGKWKEAADRMLLYNKAGGKVLEGLKRRRAAERELFLTPQAAVVRVAEAVPQPIPVPVDVPTDVEDIRQKLKKAVQFLSLAVTPMWYKEGNIEQATKFIDELSKGGYLK